MGSDDLKFWLHELDSRPYTRVSNTNAAKFFFGLPITDRKYGLVRKLDLVEQAGINGDVELSKDRMLNSPRLDRYISNQLDNFFVKNNIISYDTSIVALMSSSTSNFQPLHLHRHSLADPVDTVEFSLFFSPSSTVTFSYYDYAITKREAIKLKLVDYTDNSRLDHFLKKHQRIDLPLSNKEFVRFNGQQVAHQAEIQDGIGIFVIFTKCVVDPYQSTVAKGTL